MLLNFTKINFCVYLHLICADRILSLHEVKGRCKCSSDWDINSPYIWLFRIPLLMHDYQLQQKFCMCKIYRVTFQMMSARAPGSSPVQNHLTRCLFSLSPFAAGQVDTFNYSSVFLRIRLFGYLPDQVLQSKL